MCLRRDQYSVIRPFVEQLPDCSESTLILSSRFRNERFP